MDVLINFDERKYQSEKNSFEKFIPEIQKAVNAFNQLGLEPIRSEELELLFTKPDELVFDKMTEQKPTLIEGKEVHKHKAMELFIKPKGYENFTRIVAEVKTIFDNSIHYSSIKKISLNQFSKIYELDSNGAIVIKSSKDDELKEYYKSYAKTDKAKKILELANLIITQCNDPILSEIIKYNPDGIGNVVRHIVSGKYGNSELTLNVDGILNYNRK